MKNLEIAVDKTSHPPTPSFAHKDPVGRAASLVEEFECEQQPSYFHHKQTGGTTVLPYREREVFQATLLTDDTDHCSTLAELTAAREANSDAHSIHKQSAVCKCADIIPVLRPGCVGKLDLPLYCPVPLGWRSTCHLPDYNEKWPF